MQAYDFEKSLHSLDKMKSTYPKLIGDFMRYLNIYTDLKNNNRYKNIKIYGRLESKELYAQAIIDYISGMTDRYAIEIFNELLKY
jgi:dGTPase